MSKYLLQFVYDEESQEYKILNPKSGECVGSLRSSEPLSYLKVTTAMQKDFFDEHKDDYGNIVRTFAPFRRYCKINNDFEMNIQNLGLKFTEYQLYLYLRSRIAVKTGLVKKNHKSHLRISDICSGLKLSERTVKTGLRTLERHDIIKMNNGRIYFNPYVSYRGNSITTDLMLMFKDSVWRDFNYGKENNQK